MMRNQNKTKKDKELKNNADCLYLELYIYLRLLTTVYFVLSRCPRPKAAEVNIF